MSVKSILFVCHGNICRSPMAEFILKKMVAERGCGDAFRIESAAVSTEETGNGIYPPARRCLQDHGVPFDATRTAWQVRRSDYDRFDLIICMDRSNLRWLDRIIGDDPQDKVRLMMTFAGVSRDVADPWYTGDFEATYSDLTAACNALLDILINN